ncbi:hypothetical protein [Rhodospirillum rubrum]|uniref:Secreted protein n=1 Tax=Rhodospirillum rubrum (strain ATCC 11170 / ATH 1.1.1 / DSM 467 / LMG 4362 / NCIMB 8255 / S1) TaxID=269796 RepID=Q2RW05_RHORT|nr:hypothetical protein [Rhodospirillum rubrum]ABC21690.1 conserved hypothetical protein [Rhodospirillum rubrum ATCC 11170]AEO47388.1 hypothetical protein F11_04590 [Rhodospirillum rubrum F11]MBK5953242.1 hypothetical protein [Rhodospirillum rubrum]QXG81352.1 hypothetical protein KUL73_04640 [Rhodospirillum rubrum]HAQ01374.1 hypothetical protein [Rhodospirillum rubrum]
MPFLTAALAALGVFLLAGCADIDEKAPASRPGPQAAACQAGGGQMKPVGRMQTPRCVTPYPDAGKACDDGAQCAGDCRLAGNNAILPGTPVTGACQAEDTSFGCHARVEKGKAGPTICID